MNLHINLDSSHPAYEWLEQQADRIGAKGHFGTHIDCYTTKPQNNHFNLATYVLDCQEGMPTLADIAAIQTLENMALVLHTGNMYKNDYGATPYFETDTVLDKDVLEAILKLKPSLILIDSYGIGSHGKDHVSKDVMCEKIGCFVIENICITPESRELIKHITVNFDLDYPSNGKPCKVRCCYESEK